MHKDRYPIPLLLDFLDVPGQARIYTKVDLHAVLTILSTLLRAMSGK